ncbi:MAG: 1-deoxy-D-xylulose-5-phosphate reductoisomerase [Clostridiales bacterium]|nr:1-deoxy-D-xylulose-5-phosphate reductoisomerase [Clostridiales bacterium]
MKNISVLGSTGSIGTQTLDVIRKSNGEYKVTALTAGTDIKLLEAQAREFRPELISISREDLRKDLILALKDTDIKVVSGLDGLIEAAALPASDITLTAVVGMIGILPTIEAVKAGKDIALANKETLVTAGHIIMPLAKEMGVRILPVDSEHSAIFQCLQGEGRDGVSKLILTASGGPFRGFSAEQLENVTLDQALKHPNWSMGRKITIDSASMVNKGLEVIEASWLFDISVDNIDVIVHPQSIIHSMVEFIDGGIKAQLGSPDMRLPIQYALYYPERKFLDTERLDFSELARLDFIRPNMDVFKGLGYAYEAAKKGGSLPTVFNAANELAVARFLRKEIHFIEIYEMIDKAMKEVSFIEDPTIDQILSTEAATYDLFGA